MRTDSLAAARILIVDDEAANLRLLERILSRAGYTNHRSTANSSDVLTLVAEFEPDILLLDLHMPTLDGFGVLDQLRVRIHEDYFPVLVLTADVTGDAKERALSGGAKDFLTKPFDHTEALLRIRNLLETRFLHLETKRQNELLEEQLRQAQKSEVIGRLTGGIIHDFNNLLTVINGNAGLLLMDSVAEDAFRDDLLEIRGAAERAAALTRHLLMFSRQRRSEPSVLDLNQSISNAKKILARLLGAGIRLTVKLDPELGRVLIDESHLEQVILNLVVNARDAMPAGGTLQVETRNVLLREADRGRFPFVAPGWYVQLRVGDTGFGMDAETLQKIFTPFFTTKGQERGTGLGLSIVYGIVKQNRGYVWAESQPGSGTAFTISLPRVEGRTVSPDVSALPAELLHGSETVLVVENDEAVRSLMRRILLRSGYRVLEARDGGEALEFCEQYTGPLEVLIADMASPEITGLELIQRLQASRPDTRTLLLLGYPDLEATEANRQRAATMVLRKPFSAEEFVQTIRELIDAA